VFLVRINEELIERKVAAQVWKTEINDRDGYAPLSAKVGTKFRRQVAVAQSVYFVCGLKAAEFVFYAVRFS
jgi:hypothetical protein